MENFLTFCLFFLGLLLCIIGFTAEDKKMRYSFVLIGIISIVVVLYCYQAKIDHAPKRLPTRIIFE